MKKRILMSVLGVLLTGFLIFGAVSYFNYQTELKRNREYETSLAKALKNSYKDIKEIQFSDPSYSEKPGGWYVHVQLTFADGTKLKYGAAHHLDDVSNHDASFGGPTYNENMANLRSRVGHTEGEIKVIYSVKEEMILK
ncbi:hypothetical protein D8796_02900 [Streptococcus cristatus]|uniref:hypothetical protein n=1 Tax=Streptococcus cristatus TaxID=45634 RepID=UPI000F65E463|nr:hypothetical protein [Streptococcus cristatus]RSJ81606.1 hypothetical protein D8796_02900 [Streptococcus cristatus]RSJ82000.1 hypothetical protein D8795_01925 [Streptococcus cristatus]RSJ87065.1 hypothetical protein D8793_04325 [Streptococcus cristatus]